MKYYFKCPKCGNDESFWKLWDTGDDTGCLLLLFGGILPALIYSGRKNRINCAKCGHKFGKPLPPVGPTASFAVWIIALILLSALACLTLTVMPGLAEAIPRYHFLTQVVELVRDNPLAIVLGVLPLPVVLMTVALIVYACSAGRHRRFIGQTHKMEPTYYTPEMLANSLHESAMDNQKSADELSDATRENDMQKAEAKHQP